MRRLFLFLALTVGAVAVADPSLEVIAQSYEQIAGKNHLRLTVRTNSPGKLVIQNPDRVGGTGDCHALGLDVYQCTAIVPALNGGILWYALTDYWLETPTGERSRVHNLTELL